MPFVCQTSALDHRDFQDLSQITYPSDSCMPTAVAINIYKASSVHPFHADVLQLHICSAQHSFM